jgi:recombination protein RecT
MSTQTQVQTKRPVATIRTLLEGDQFKSQVAKALPSHLKPERFIRVALTTMMRTPKLAQCDQASFFNALLTLSQLGIEPDGRRAHLIPFENRKRNVTECQLIIDYKGLAELAMRSGVVANLHADVVCENDEFEYDRGQLVRHKIDFRKPRGDVYAAYAICRFKDGTEKSEVMSRDDIEGIRKRSRAGNGGPWVTDWNEMAKKSAFRRLSKWLPLSAEFRDAVEADDEIETSTPKTAPGELVDVIPFEIPAQIEDSQNSQDSAEAEAGLAPAAEAKETSKPKSDEKTPQVQLMELVTEAGFTFSHLQAWGTETGNLPDGDSCVGFREVKTDVAVRLLRASKGLLAGLAVAKGVAA